MMQLNEIAQELVAGCREDRARANLEKLYAPDAVSVEAADMGQGREAKGVEAIKAKHDWWESTMEVAEAHVSDPMPHGEDRFAVDFPHDRGREGQRPDDGYGGSRALHGRRWQDRAGGILLRHA